LKFLLLFLVIASTNSIACEIFLKNQIIINDIIDSPNWSFLKTNCSKEKIKFFSKSVKYFEGEIPQSILQKKLKKFGISIISSTGSIKIKRISKVIKGVFHPLLSKEITSDDFVTNITTDKYTVKNTNNEVNLTLLSERDKYTFQAKIRRNIMFAKKNITPFEKENLNSLFIEKNEWIESENSSTYFKNKQDLKKHLAHYKINKFISKNKPIKKSDFTKKNLLKFGQPAKIIFNNSNLTIKTSGIPQSNGGINDLVLIKLKNNEIISAKVVDLGVVSANL